MSKNSIRVVDPCGKTVSRTTYKKALVYVGRGQARWRGNAIEPIESDFRCLAAADSKSRAIKAIYINGHGFATLQGAKGLPLAGDEVRLFMGKRPAEPPRDWPTVEISRRSVPYFDAPAPVPLWEGKRLA